MYVKVGCAQGITRRGQRRHNYSGAESLWQWGHRITEKSQQCHRYFLQCSTFASERC